MENSIPFKRPEQALRPVAEQLLRLLFSAEISDDDLQLVAVTLVEIIAQCWEAEMPTTRKN
jgi:hypothetical protein